MARYGAGGVNMNGNMFQTFDYGSSVQSGQMIQENRLKNQALADDQQQRQDMLRNRKKAQEVREMYDTMPDQIAALESESLYEQADDLRNQYIKTRKTEVDLLTTLRDSIDETNYKQFRSELLTSGAVTPDMMPVEYSDDWFRKQKDDKLGKLNQFTQTSFENGAIMSRDTVTQDGKVRWDLTGKWYDTAKSKKTGSGSGAGSGKAFEFKPADTNAIAKQAAELYGGFWDPVTQRISGLDPVKAQKVQTIREQASRIFGDERSKGNGAFSHSVAVSRAARLAGVPIEDLENAAATDPLGLNTQ
jgi:hypothetical protein